MKIKQIILISRPIFWCIPLLLFISGFYLKYNTFNLESGIFLVLLTIPINFIIYGINDIFDYDSDKLNPRKGSIEGVVLNLKNKNKVFLISSIFSLIILGYSIIISPSLFLIVLLSIIFSLMYSVPPIRLKTKPPFDSILNGIGYSLFFLMGVCFYEFNSVPLKLIIPMIISIAATHAHSTIVDYEYDKKTKEKTLSILIGKKATIIISALSYFIIPILFWFETLILNITFIFISILIGITYFSPKPKNVKIVNIIILLCFVILISYYFIKLFFFS